MKTKLSTGVVLSLLLCIFIPFGYAYENLFNKGERVINEALNLQEREEEREEVINETLHRIELSLEFGFATQGTQIFELVDDQGNRVSRLEYPHQGEMLIFKGEVGFLSKFSLGGRYGSSLFKRKTAIDQDWIPPIEEIWWESESRCKSEVEFYDFNLYYRLMDLDEDEMEQRRLSSEGSTIFDYLMVDRLSLDVFAGYQQQKGRYPVTDGVDTIEWWTPVYEPFSGLDSFYKIRYKGPRFGLRAEGSKGKFTTRVSFAYAWLKTKAYGWWNLRDLSFWQEGKNGYGTDIAVEMTYSFTPSLSAGLGFNYLYCRQKKLKMYAVEAGTPWWDGYQDRIRNANSKIYGPSFILRYIW